MILSKNDLVIETTKEKLKAIKHKSNQNLP